MARLNSAAIVAVIVLVLATAMALVGKLDQDAWLTLVAGLGLGLPSKVDSDR